jgi:hypothetical protein
MRTQRLAVDEQSGLGVGADEAGGKQGHAGIIGTGRTRGARQPTRPDLAFQPGPGELDNHATYERQAFARRTDVRNALSAQRTGPPAGTSRNLISTSQ